ncbi:NAD-dependent epimerase/dehydratase family protein [Rhodococcus triatomae]|uniref:UDP-glucose 4-epimerase n=1 Tax=Rhodococcus triatomae TaxID=300028 RepID=A0A1G8R0J8_9NOCA|nr:NAD-dependent epimerase/dehydratase family protein [Rhodococcus triatomae]QNG20734.1 NAD-dependent epimerase/dehydratase family protein [Rhodococcus triatomae]QNG23349.1 NAD-dependent epimerase/dehydratase family protein [Rhodococcus triatomae]SDJ10383.1 UDP-glucose 4-epimerase [Rhodococcus triatomae]
MDITVTGATGYVGAHCTAALLEAGHRVRLLVLPGESTHTLATHVGAPWSDVEIVAGDIRDPATVDALLDGADALLHAAGVVGTDDTREQLMWEVNTEATTTLLTRSALAGLDPIVHVASFSALFPSPDPVIGPDSPTARARSAYGRSKAAADRVARALQQAGAPVVVTYPSSVVGPGVGGTPGITEQGWGLMVANRVAPRLNGGMQMIDVLDVAAVHAAVMTPGRGPRRYVCGGELIPFDELVDVLEAASGRPIRRIPLPGAIFRSMGRLADVVGRFTPISAGLSYEAAWLLTSATPTDDSRTRDELGLQWRSPRAAIARSFAT